MDSQPSAVVVVLGTIAFAVGTILALFVWALLFGRHAQMKTRDASLIRQQVTELWKQRQDAASRWLRWRILVSLATIAPFAIVILTGRYYLFPVVIAMVIAMLPVSFILYGLEIQDLKYAVINLPFRPVRLLTGDAAVRYGIILLAVGIAPLLFCALLVVLAVF
jgi:hypothetical protein